MAMSCKLFLGADKEKNLRHEGAVKRMKDGHVEWSSGLGWV